MEKRFFRRVSINNGICTLAKDRMYTGIIENISLGGLFVTSDVQLKIRDKVGINITLPTDSRSIAIETNAVTTRIGDKGVAFKFDKLNPKDFWTLQSFIQCAKA